MPYSPAESYALSTVSITCSTISFASCVFIILCWILFKDLKKLAYGFVFYMASATLVRQFAKTWGGDFLKGEPLCTIQGFLMIYGGLSTFYWIMSIAIVMYTMIFHPFMWFQESTISKCNKISLIVNFSVPLFFALLPVITDNYGPTGGWCWIEGTTTLGKMYRWVSFYGQLLVIMTFCIFAYIRIYVYLKFSKNADKLKATHKMYNRIKYYPLCLILGYSVAMTRRFIELWDVHLGFGWAMMTSITTGLFGFFLLMVYGRLGKLNKLFKQKYPCCIPICDNLCCCLEGSNPDEDKEGSSRASRTSVTAQKSKVAVKSTTRKSTHNTQHRLSIGPNTTTSPAPSPTPPPTEATGGTAVNRPSIVVSPAPTPPLPTPPPPRPPALTGRSSTRSNVDLIVNGRDREASSPMPPTPSLVMSDTKMDVLKEVIGERRGRR